MGMNLMMGMEYVCVRTRFMMSDEELNFGPDVASLLILCLKFRR